MVRKLRRKFIAVNMTLVIFILLFIFVFHLFTEWKQLSDTTEDALRRASDVTQHGQNQWQVAPPKPDEKNSRADPEQSLLVPVFCVTVEGGELVTVNSNNLTVDPAVVEAASTAALAAEENIGTLRELSLRYMRLQTLEGWHISFADLTWQTPAMSERVLSALLILSVAAVGFALVSVFLAHWVTRPTEEAWKQQRQFVADASHELKTPITIILADADILLSHPEDTVASQKKWVEYIREEAMHLKRLAEDLLFLTRGDDMGHPARPDTPVAFSDLCWSCLLSFEPLAFERGAVLTPLIAPDVTLPGHEDQLRRLVSILLDNASKYCGPGGEVTLTLERSGSRATLRVHNTGAPIPPEDLPHLFDRFYRVDKSRARDAGGSGLGLPIAEAIVHAHGGSVSVTSGEGGTCFTVVFPL